MSAGPTIAKPAKRQASKARLSKAKSSKAKGSKTRSSKTKALDPKARVADLAELEDRLDYRFADRRQLALALTHAGAAKNRASTYQRLEFLGDRVLGVAVASMLYAAFPEADEGELSRRLAVLVRRESCAAVAVHWDVDPHIRLAPGEVKSLDLRQAILGDICEAIIGAVFVDGGLAAAEALVQRSFGAQMLAPARPLRDSKSTLQDWAQARGLPAPVYRERGRTGPDHVPEFTVAVVIEGQPEVDGTGASKRLAEHAAAAAFIAREGLEGQDT